MTRSHDCDHSTMSAEVQEGRIVVRVHVFAIPSIEFREELTSKNFALSFKPSQNFAKAHIFLIIHICTVPNLNLGHPGFNVFFYPLLDHQYG